MKTHRSTCRRRAGTRTSWTVTQGCSCRPKVRQAWGPGRALGLAMRCSLANSPASPRPSCAPSPDTRRSGAPCCNRHSTPSSSKSCSLFIPYTYIRKCGTECARGWLLEYLRILLKRGRGGSRSRYHLYKWSRVIHMHRRERNSELERGNMPAI